MVKRFAAFMAALLLTLLPMSGIVSAATLSGNPIVNNSMETAADANTPTSWTNNKWGANDATFSYIDGDAQHGAKSVKVTMGTYTDGDAKWFAAPVVLTAGTTYTYTDYYKSDVTTRVVAAYASSTGTLTYGDLPDAPAASNWTAYSGDFTVPSGTASVTVYHLLDKVGYLQMDNVAIADTVTLPPSTGELDIPNPSVEQSNDGKTPLGWQANGWGNNTRNFEYVNDGHNSSKSVKVTVSNYVDGDAKWYFNPITTLKTDGQYRVKMWYKTNAQAHAVVMYTNASGAQSFFGMPTPTPQVGQDATTTWQPYNATFSVPQGAVSVSVFMNINQNGWLQTDDFSLENYAPQGFSEPMISLTFDDGHEENQNEALAKMNALGFKSTQCYATTFIENADNGEQTALDGIKKFTDAGHEICSHTVTHPDLTTLSANDLKHELEYSKQYLTNMLTQIGVPASQQTVVPNFASPYGAYNATVNQAIKDAGYQSHRTVNEGYNSIDNFNAYELKVQNMLSTTTLAQVQSWIDQAKKDNTWLVLVYHRVANNPGQYDTYINDFNAQMDAIKNSGVAVKTYQEAFTSAKAQAEGNPNPGDTTPPSISNVTVDHNNGSTRVDWKASEFATHSFVYGKTTGYELTGDVQISGEGDLTNSRYVNLTLEPGTKYFYKVTATDNAGNVGFHVAEFTTPQATTPVDTTPPVVQVAVDTNYQPRKTLVTFESSEAFVDAKIEVGNAPSYGNTIEYTTVDGKYGFILDLTPSTLFYYKVSVTDATGNVGTKTGTFTTPVDTTDTTPPTVTEPSFQNMTLTTAGVSVATPDELAKAWIEYGTTEALGTKKENPAYNHSHYFYLTDLAPATTYHFKITVSDDNGNETAKSGTFTTKKLPDFTAVYEGIPADNTNMLLGWTTDVQTTATFEYGTTEAYGSTAPIDVCTDGVSYMDCVDIFSLTPNTKYYYKITITDADNLKNEYRGEYVTRDPSEEVFGDITGDGLVDDDDATVLFANWGDNPAAGDLDNNGVVDDDDATLLFANWSM